MKKKKPVDEPSACKMLGHSFCTVDDSPLEKWRRFLTNTQWMHREPTKQIFGITYYANAAIVACELFMVYFCNGFGGCGGRRTEFI